MQPVRTRARGAQARWPEGHAAQQVDEFADQHRQPFNGRQERPEGSYVVALLDAPGEAARKVGEEGLEAALAGVSESDERLISELADLWFHSYVLLAARGLDPDDVEAELRRRVR